MEAGTGAPARPQRSRRGLLWGMLIAAILLAVAVSGCSCEEAVTVPDVVGLQEAEAESALTDAGLAIGAVERVSVDAATAEPDTVVSQLPSAGGEVDAGTEVALVVAEDAEEASEEEDAPVAKSSSEPVPTTKPDPKPAATKEGPPQGGEIADDQGWIDTGFTSSGKGPYLSPTFGINSNRVKLACDIHSPQMGELTFDLLEAGDPSRSVLHWVVPVTPKPTDHLSVPATVALRDDYKLQIKVSQDISSPNDVVWAVSVFEQLP